MKRSTEYLYLRLCDLHQRKDSPTPFRRALVGESSSFTIFSASAPRQAPWM